MRTLILSTCVPFLWLSLITVLPCAAQDSPDDHLFAARDDLQWFRDAKFGVFICWGPCSLKEGEIGWSRWGPRPGHRSEHADGGVPVEIYDNLYKEFNPTQFSAKEWVDVIQASGARYMIFLTKHHDGFCMFDTKYSEYKITNTPFGRDVTAGLAQACQDAGIRIFWYYSQPDWHHPDYRTENHSRYIEYLHNQIRELCTNYGKIDGIWFDGLGGKVEDWDSAALFKLIRTRQPHALINNRAGLPGDFDTPEQRVGQFNIERPWESCMTMSVGWSWRGEDKPVKSLKECLHLLIRCAGGGGNLALDTGPMPDGRIHPLHAQRYKEMGQWLSQYGESIYGTTGGPYKPGQWGVSTRKGNVVYLHVLDWPEEKVSFPPLGKQIVSTRALTGGKPSVSQTAESLVVRIPSADQDPIDTIIALDLHGSSLDIAPMSCWGSSLTQYKKAAASSEWSPGYSAAMAIDGDVTTRWGGEPGSRSGWLEVDLGEPMTFDRVIILEAPWNRVQRFQVQCLEGETWRTFHAGRTLGDFELRFEPITAQRVRLDLLEANEVPTIWEFQLFAPKKGTS